MPYDLIGSVQYSHDDIFQTIYYRDMSERIFKKRTWLGSLILLEEMRRKFQVQTSPTEKATKAGLKIFNQIMDMIELDGNMECFKKDYDLYPFAELAKMAKENIEDFVIAG